MFTPFDFPGMVWFSDETIVRWSWVAYFRPDFCFIQSEKYLIIVMSVFLKCLSM